MAKRNIILYLKLVIVAGQDYFQREWYVRQKKLDHVDFGRKAKGSQMLVVQLGEGTVLRFEERDALIGQCSRSILGCTNSSAPRVKKIIHANGQDM